MVRKPQGALHCLTVSARAEDKLYLIEIFETHLDLLCMTFEYPLQVMHPITNLFDSVNQVD